MSDTGSALVPVVTVPVRREDRQWVVEVPDEGVWTHGRSLNETRDRAHAAVALARDIEPDCIAVQVRVDCPEVAALEEARSAARDALAAAVARLRMQGVSWPEVAAALHVTGSEARKAWASVSASK
jgi:predicted RNase H-like HicB family nuclease